MKTGTISHRRESRYLVVREDYLSMCEGNYVAAMLLGLFEYWYDIMSESVTQAKIANDTLQEQGESRTQSEELWVWKSYDDLEQDLMGMFGRKPITNAMKLLTDKEYVLRRNHPDYKWDKKPQYLLNLRVVRGEIIDHYPTGSPTIPKGDHRSYPNGIVDDAQRESSRAGAGARARVNTSNTDSDSIVNKESELYERIKDETIKTPRHFFEDEAAQALNPAVPSGLGAVGRAVASSASGSGAVNQESEQTLNEYPSRAATPDLPTQAARSGEQTHSSLKSAVITGQRNWMNIKTVKGRDNDKNETDKTETPKPAIAGFIEQQMKPRVENRRPISKRAYKRLLERPTIHQYIDPTKRNTPYVGKGEEHPSPEELWQTDPMFREYVAERVKFALRNDKPTYELAVGLVVDYAKPKYGWIDYKFSRTGTVSTDEIQVDWSQMRGAD